MKHIKMNWIFLRGHWEFSFQVDLRTYKYETWDGLLAQDIIRAGEHQKTGHALNMAKSYCTRLDKLQMAAKSVLMQPELPLQGSPVDTEAETVIISRAKLQDATGVCPECKAIGYGDGKCLSCKVHICEEGMSNGRHVQR